MLSASTRLVHSAHSGVGWHWGFGFFDVAHHALGGQQHAGDGGGVLQGNTGNLGGVDNTALEQVLVALGAGMEAENFALVRKKTLNNSSESWAKETSSLNFITSTIAVLSSGNIMLLLCKHFFFSFSYLSFYQWLSPVSLFQYILFTHILIRY